MTAAAAPTPLGSSGAADYDPGQHTVAEVIGYVAEHPDQRAAVLQAEQAGKARTTLMDALGG